ncbi:PAS domain S-box protein [Candidatus Riflebacteria bacterium]
MENMILKETEICHWEWNLVNNSFSFFGNLTGFSRIDEGEEIKDLQQLCQKYAHNQELERLANILKKPVEKIPQNGFSFQAVGKNGDIRWLYIPRATVRKYSASQKPETIQGIIIDITEMEKSDREKDRARWRSNMESADEIITIAKDRARWRSTIETAVDGIITINETGIIESVNSACEKMFGFTREEMLGKNVSMLAPSPHREQHDTYMKNYLDTGKSRIIGIGREVKARRKDGTLFPVDLAVSEFKLEGNSFFTGIVRDISEKKESEARLRKLTRALKESNSELENFASIASHDLQEPLRKISSFSQLLAMECEDSLDEDGKMYLDKIGTATKRMSLLIQGLLEFSRISRRELVHETVNLNALIKVIISDLEMKIRETGAKIEVADLPPIKGGEIQLRQLFQNLIANGLKFVKKDVIPRIKISSREVMVKQSDSGDGSPAGDSLEIRVQDNGIGIEKRNQKKVFEIFQRLHRRTSYEGSGIGLAVCQKIVARYGGRISLESQPDRGTTFIVLLPFE